MNDFWMIQLHKNNPFWWSVIIMRSTFSIAVSQTNFPRKTLSMVQTVHIPTVWNDTSLHPAYLKGNFLSAQLSQQLFIPRHYSSSRAHQLTVGSSELLLLLYLSLLSNFPPLSSFLPLIANQPPCKPALHLPLWNFSGFCSFFCCRPARSFHTQFTTGHFVLCFYPWCVEFPVHLTTDKSYEWEIGCGILLIYTQLLDKIMINSGILLKIVDNRSFIKSKMQRLVGTEL